MITFKQFLAEDGQKNLQAIINEYHLNYNEWPLDSPLGRIDGRDSVGQISIQPPRSEPRERSRAGTSKIQAFLTNQTSWAEIPGRSHALFTTTKPGDGSYAQIFGSTGDTSYMVIPRNSAKIGMVPDDMNMRLFDIGGSDINLQSLSNHDFTRASNAIKLAIAAHGFTYQAENNFTTVQEVLDGIRYLTEKGVDDGEEVTGYRRFTQLAEFIDEHGDVSPEVFGITTASPSTYVAPSETHEAWFTDDYLLIHSNFFHKFVKMVQG